MLGMENMAIAMDVGWGFFFSGAAIPVEFAVADLPSAESVERTV